MTQAAIQTSGINPGTVLVVEDTTTIRTLVTAILGRNRYRVLAVSSAEEALDVLARSQPDVMITDVDMPGMNGIALCREVQRVVRHPMHIIILSRLGDQVVDGLNAGAADYICKPFAANELLARVSSGMRIVARQNAMLSDQSRLRSSVDELRADRERVGRDLDAAAELQSGLLPPPVLRSNGFTVSCAVQAQSLLSGDTLGVLPPRPGEVTIYSADVAGKGAPAALLATAIAQELRSDDDIAASGSVGDSLPPSRLAHEVVARLNKRFFNFANSDRYFTMACAVLDADRHTLSICVAGHPRPAILTASGEVRYVGDGGFPVGMLANATYQSLALPFLPGDRIILFTDGFIEASLPGGSQLGYQGLAEMLRSLAEQRVEDLPLALVKDLSGKIGRALHDDVSVVAAAYSNIQ